MENKALEIVFSFFVWLTGWWQKQENKNYKATDFYNKAKQKLWNNVQSDFLTDFFVVIAWLTLSNLIGMGMWLSLLFLRSILSIAIFVTLSEKPIKSQFFLFVWIIMNVKSHVQWIAVFTGVTQNSATDVAASIIMSNSWETTMIASAFWAANTTLNLTNQFNGLQCVVPFLVDR